MHVDHLLKIKKEFKNDFKDLAKRTIADKVLRDKTFKIASDQKYDMYQRGLASMVYRFFDKKSQGSAINIPLY